MAINAPLESSVAVGNSPDMVFVDSVRIGDYIKKGLLAPLPEEVSTEGLQPELVSIFEDNGQLYALPHDVQPLALMVNRQLLDANGLTDPETWDELLSASQAINDPDQGVFGIGLSPGLWNFLPFLYQAGGELLTAQGTLALDSDRAREAMAFYRDLGATAYIAQLNWPDQGAYDELLGQFIDQKIAMLVAGPGMYNAMRQDCADCSAEIIPLPAGPAGQATIAVVRGFGLTPDGLSKGEPAIRFLQYAESAEGMQHWIGESTDPLDFIPARPDLRDAWLANHPEGQAFLDSIAFTHNLYLNRATLSTIQQFDQAAGNGLNDLLLQNANVEDVLQELQATGADLLEKQQ
jgi:multiple sugar transport system substrate-binding protein